ncbi:endonuclease NucS [Bacillus shivajii]|uniref:endonuclease NucS domain-containing protein n=1 Tax=Bacillus shivajii TaxID=1983719 RepID=UPI001CFA0EFB|nr:endonuclease NucS domain-containing protein [Bacillus shivajii]UCZ54975.1 endonuclease NucS [Bacillus shivajii]
MKEQDLQYALILYPHLIEEGLVFKEREVYLEGKRCDLLFEDKDGRDVYVEVKLKVTDSAVGQLIRYAGLVHNPEARFMLVGLSFQDGIKEGLTKNGYEYKEVAESDIYALVFSSKLEAEMIKRKIKINGKQQQKPVKKVQNKKVRSKTKEEEQFHFLFNEVNEIKSRLKRLEKDQEKNMKHMLSYIDMQMDRLETEESMDRVL